MKDSVAFSQLFPETTLARKTTPIFLCSFRVELNVEAEARRPGRIIGAGNLCTVPHCTGIRIRAMTQANRW